jgi:hypothetical protein
MSKEKQSRREFLKISAAGITTFGFMKNLKGDRLLLSNRTPS